MFDLVNLLDIFIIAALIYSLYMWLKGTRAYHILIGLGILGILYSIANWSGLLLTSQILQYLLGVTLLLIIVVFQPEIRQLLERVSPLVIFRLQSSPISRRILKEITEACFELSEKRIGGLLVFPRATGISGVVQHGVKLDSLVSQELVVSIFHPSSPIHDGAIIVEKDRVVEAATYLPLSTREHLPPRYGTRHRAALGVSELGDTFCVVVSEESGEVSVASGGDISAMADREKLWQTLEKSLLPIEIPRSRPSMREAMKKIVALRQGYRFNRNNLTAKLASIGVACLLWFFLIGQQLSEIAITAALEFQNIPANIELIDVSTSEVNVRVRGPQGSISTQTADQVRVMVDLDDMEPGTLTMPLTDANVELPYGVVATSIDPRSLTIKSDRIVNRRIMIDYDLTGQLPEGLELARDVRVDPPSVPITGREMELDQIERIITSPAIDLSQLTASQIFDCTLKVLPQNLTFASFSIEGREVSVHIDLRPVGDGQSVSEETAGLDRVAASPQTSLNNRLNSP
ncbi:MAG: TIGR00159 family protein [Gemmatimonadetes bacterium]|nr:TIGR00159 family protein [Gemmatimonadota bacterium]MYD24582.1 TIGR00159 family protein [Gemmatimonadota bacterium]